MADYYHFFLDLIFKSKTHLKMCLNTIIILNEFSGMSDR